MFFAKSITQEDVKNLEIDLERAKSSLIEQQKLLKGGAIASAAKEIKAEFEMERKKVQKLIDNLENGLTVLSGIGNLAIKAINLLSIPTNHDTKEVVTAFTYAVSALKNALNYLKDSRLVKIDEKERAALEKNANSWNHLTFNNIEEVEEELAKRRKERESKSTLSGESALACGVVSSVCLAGMMYPPVRIAALAVPFGLSAIRGVAKFFKRPKN